MSVAWRMHASGPVVASGVAYFWGLVPWCLCTMWSCVVSSSLNGHCTLMLSGVSCSLSGQPWRIVDASCWSVSSWAVTSLDCQILFYSALHFVPDQSLLCIVSYLRLIIWRLLSALDFSFKKAWLSMSAMNMNDIAALVTFFATFSVHYILAWKIWVLMVCDQCG